MSARTDLRAATQAAHARVDALFTGHGIGTRDGYVRFLRAQAAAYLPVERALDAGEAATLIPAWNARRRADLLLADLAALGEETPPQPPLAFDTEPAMLGAAYVLEGSRLGGRVLARMVPPGLSRAFLSAPPQPGMWRTLTDFLDHRLSSRHDLDRAVDAALTVFGCFEAAGAVMLETGVE